MARRPHLDDRPLSGLTLAVLLAVFTGFAVLLSLHPAFHMPPPPPFTGHTTWMPSKQP